MGAKWKLDPADVCADAGIGGGGSRTAQRRRHTVRHLLSYSLRHIPTGIAVSIEVTARNLTKKERLRLQETLYRQLFPQLESRVAKHLRIPGR